MPPYWPPPTVPRQRPYAGHDEDNVWGDDNWGDEDWTDEDWGVHGQEMDLSHEMPGPGAELELG